MKTIFIYESRIDYGEFTLEGILYSPLPYLKVYLKDVVVIDSTQYGKEITLSGDYEIFDITDEISDSGVIRKIYIK